MKTHYYLIVILCCSLLACNNPMNNKREIIRGMEQAILQNTNDQFLRPLVANYINYAADYPKDEMTAVYLYRCAVIYYRVGNVSDASVLLEQIIREHPDTPLIEDTYLTLAMISNKGGYDKERAEELYTIYKQKYPSGKGISEVDYYFKPAADKLLDNIKRIQNEIANLPRGEEDSPAKYSQLTWAYINYIKAKPDGAITPAYCMQGARLAIRLDYHLVAIELLDKIYNEYKTFEQYPEAMLLLAVQYDTNIKSYLQKENIVSTGTNPRIQKEELLEKNLTKEAEKIYKEILQKFPTHKVAPSAKAGLKNLGKRTAKIIEEFLAKQDSIQQAISGQTESGQ